HPGSFTWDVISRGGLHVAPSSPLSVTQTESLLTQNTRTTLPVSKSTTGAGLPAVCGPASQRSWTSSHVFPPSKLRLKSRSISPSSAALYLLPSQKASNVPLGVTTTAGMRYV